MKIHSHGLTWKVEKCFCGDYFIRYECDPLQFSRWYRTRCEECSQEGRDWAIGTPTATIEIYAPANFVAYRVRTPNVVKEALEPEMERLRIANRSTMLRKVLLMSALVSGFLVCMLILVIMSIMS